ncbi:helix-turn-helix domain-containing protein [Zavarzinia sp.]|uniref:helix-turn-helix domain-containing protein n=1 Tax=Zavarzinia sp. TaxID=2027920 RepID=UPI003BB76315
MSVEQARSGRPEHRREADVATPIDFPALVAEALPGAAVNVDQPSRNDGEWWFDIKLDGAETQVSWTSWRGYGVYLGEPGYGERPSETYGDARLVVRRLQQIVGNRNSGAVLTPMGMGQVRRLLGRTQADIAAALHIGQANVSRLEGRANPTLGSIRALIEAMGGQLEVRAKFPDLDIPIALPDSEADV